MKKKSYKKTDTGYKCNEVCFKEIDKCTKKCELNDVGIPFCKKGRLPKSCKESCCEEVDDITSVEDKPVAEENKEPVLTNSVTETVEDLVSHPQDEMKEPVVADPPIFQEVEESVIAERHKLIGAIEESEKPNDDGILAGQLGKKPLEDLRTGIPLNEKFGIIRGLFAGNASDFGDAVLKLNNAASVNEMKHYLEIMQQRFGWDLESDSYQTFSVYVERKMMTHQLSNANADQ